MADFRKLILVLAIMAVATSAAYGQLICSATPAGNPTLRAGGITELTGESDLSCTGGTPGAAMRKVGVTVQMQNAIAVTNHITGSVTGVGSLTNAALRVTDFNGNVVQLVQGVLQSNTSNLVLFRDVVLPAGTDKTVRIRIGNIRVAVATMASTQTAVPVYEYVTTSVNIGDPSVIIQNPLLTIGQVLPAFDFAVTKCDGTAGGVLSFQQCIAEPRSGVEGALSFGVRFTERSPGAFRTMTEEDGFTYSGPAGTADVPSVTSITDPATNATRLMVQFTNVPAGVNIFVTNREIAGVDASTAGSMAVLVKGAAADGSGGVETGASSDVPADCSGAVSNNSATAVGLVQANKSGSTIYAVWAITGDTTSNVDSLVFGVQVQFEANPGAGLPGLSTVPGSVSGNLAPFVPTTYVPAADDSSPIPRFFLQSVGANVFSIGPCVTNLLFPYVTTLSGYNTGLAVANTSLDNVSTGTDTPVPFDTSSQTGGCTLYFFGSNAPDAQTTDKVGTPLGDVKPGTVWKGVASDMAPGFEGYVIARCNFQYAHGLAFILAPSGSGSQYLALVIPDRGGVRGPDPFPVTGAGTGEQLGY